MDSGELFGLPEEVHAARNPGASKPCRDPIPRDDADLTGFLAAYLMVKLREDTEKYLINTIEREGVGYFQGYLHGDVSLVLVIYLWSRPKVRLKTGRIIGSVAN
jgi:hypothetical protein